MLVSMTDLWLPVLLSGLLTWIASAVIHVVLPYHKSDYKALSNESDVMDAVRQQSPSPGIYNFPYCADMKDMGDENVIAKFNKGPVGMLTVFPNGTPPMGKLMAQQISFCLLGCLLIGYCAALTLSPGTDYLVVFRSVCTIGFLTFGWAQIPFSIWYGHPWSTTFKYLFDGLIYGLIAAGVFGWLWPALG